MKNINLLFFLILSFGILRAQQKAENLIIVTTDGFRWEEVFKGMDSSLANDPRFNQGDSELIYKKYWAFSAEERREKLLPFIWQKVAREGQLYGNRMYGTKVDNANPYWFSYPGYNEIFTGYADTAINSNDYKANPNTNLLEYINRQHGFNGKVAAFGAWSAFDRILNKDRCGFPVVSAFDKCGGKNPTGREQLLNEMVPDSYTPFGDDECQDVFTFYEAFEYLKNNSPRVLYITLGETDDFAHAGHYEDYLDAAHHFDHWLNKLWNYLQILPQYRDKTALFIAVDHGRGDKVKSEWTSHGRKISDSHEIWFAALGPGIAAKGEVKVPLQLFQNQYAQTMAGLLGLKFKAEHPVGDPILLNK